MSDYDLPKQKEEEEKQTKPALPHLKPAISLYVLYDEAVYTTNLANVEIQLRPYL